VIKKRTRDGDNKAVTHVTIDLTKDNPFARVFRAHQESLYSKAMAGIGRIAAEVARLEFVLDTIGWRLVGELDTYTIFTERMTTGTKAQRVQQLAESLLPDGDTKDQVKGLCEETRNLLHGRNDAIHSMYIDEPLGGLIRMKFPGGGPPKEVDPEDLFALAERISELVKENADAERLVNQAMADRREAAIALSKTVQTKKKR